MDTLLGRQRELTDLLNLIPDHRLITLAAPGGMGKTRLAQATLAQVKFPDGAYFVSLAPLRSSDGLVRTIAEAIGYLFDKQGASPQAQLIQYLQPRRVLLCLDNLEGLPPDGLTLITTLLDEAPHLHVLITARERLNLSREMVYHLRGLEAASLDLFVQTARRLQPDFTLTPDVEKICELVGGMPLGIILAAAWVDVLTPADILAELRRNFDLLAGRWHDTPGMQAVFEYMWARLALEEKQVFMRLAVARGGLTRDAATQIAGASLPILTGLINKSLLWQQGGRYFSHELLRQYAEQQLAASPDEAVARQTHALYYAHWLATHTPAMQDQRQWATLQLVETELENIRAAWDWLAARQDSAISHLLDGLMLFFDLRGLWADGERWLRETPLQKMEIQPRLDIRALGLHLMGISPEKALPDLMRQTHQQIEAVLPRLHIRADLALGWFLRALTQIDPLPELEAALHRSFDLYQQEEDTYGMAQVYYLRGFIASKEDIPAGIGLTRQSVALRRVAGDQINLMDSLVNLGAMLIWQGEYNEAKACYEEALQIATSQRNWLRILYVRQGLGSLAFHVGDFAEAERQSNAVLQLAADYHYAFGIIVATNTLFYTRMGQGDYVQAWQLFYECPTLDPVEKALGLGTAALGLGNDEVARSYLATVLRSEKEWHQIGALRGVAYLLLQQGRIEQATRFFSLVWHYSLRSQVFIKRLPLFREASVRLQGSHAWQMGKTLTVQAAVQEALDYLENPIPLTTPTLIEPLSTREREVLALVAAGLSNQQVADHLVVDISTVKKHLTHIYDKLSVTSRTQAILHARRLNLI